MLAIVLLIFGASVFVWLTRSIGYALPLFGLALLVVFASLLSVAVQTVETTLMRKSVLPQDLVEGDWVLGGLVAGDGSRKKRIIPKGTVSVSAAQIALACKLAPKTRLTVKQGIPFVPSFFFAYVALLLFARL